MIFRSTRKDDKVTDAPARGVDEWTNDFDVAHSERNILAWMKYLPQDCIETMIRMGWDCST